MDPPPLLTTPLLSGKSPRPRGGSCTEGDKELAGTRGTPSALMLWEAELKSTQVARLRVAALGGDGPFLSPLAWQEIWQNRAMLLKSSVFLYRVLLLHTACRRGVHRYCNFCKYRVTFFKMEKEILKSVSE